MTSVNCWGPLKKSYGGCTFCVIASKKSNRHYVSRLSNILHKKRQHALSANKSRMTDGNFTYEISLPVLVAIILSEREMC
jgi:hypothetical protein